jgi:FtsP/CotA-like multicopper oxidase with cupredoxin domain/peroxiredoxin
MFSRGVSAICAAVAVGCLSADRAFGRPELTNPPEVRSVNGVCDVLLEAAVRTHPFPAATGGDYQLRSPVYVLREANGKPMAGEGDPGALVGPTIRVRRGDRLRIRVKNSLDAKLLPTELLNPPEDYPQGFADTNLHTHGLHVSPAGKGDNIYVEIKPGEEHLFEYRILADHPAGTFWYHPHKHGSVALQLTGGMAGALIVDDEADCLFPEIKPAEKVMVLQQFHATLNPKPEDHILSPKLDIYDKAAASAAAAAGQPAPQRSWRFRRARSRNRAESAAAKPASAVAPADDCTAADAVPTHDNVNEWLVVDGQSAPTITVRPGELQRWRFVHAGIDEVIKLAVLKTGKDKDGKATRDFLPLYEIAVDGLPRERMTARPYNYLYPGYRWDVLFKAPDAVPDADTTIGVYSDCAPAGATLSSFATRSRLIATIRVVASPLPAGMSKELDLPTADRVLSCVPLQLRGGISDTEVAGRRWILKFDFPDGDPSRFFIDGREYSPRIDRFVRVGTAEEWRIESGTGTKNAAGHPFHVHVNPFLHYVYRDLLSLNVSADGVTPTKATLLTGLGLQQGDTVVLSGKLWTGDSFTSSTSVGATTSIGDLGDRLRADLNSKFPNSYSVDTDQVDLDGRARALVVRATRGAVTDLSIAYQSVNGDKVALSFTRDRELIDRIWRDTLMAPAGRMEVVRMRFRDWTGDTVLHCHIVDHEDQGMMKNIRILGPEEPVPPAGAEAGVHGRRRAEALPVRAPEFSLSGAGGQWYGTRDLAGHRAVIVFFRGGRCLECARQLQAFRQVHEQLTANGVALVAISSTTSEDLCAALRDLPAEKRFAFPVLADPVHGVFRRYGCVATGDEEPLHGTFVIDEAGEILWRSVGAEPYMDVHRVLQIASGGASNVPALRR